MTWMEEHMFLADCFPKEANLPATCNVINCAVLFKDKMPDRESIDKLVREKVMSSCAICLSLVEPFSFSCYHLRVSRAFLM